MLFVVILDRVKKATQQPSSATLTWQETPNFDIILRDIMTSGICNISFSNLSDFVFHFFFIFVLIVFLFLQFSLDIDVDRDVAFRRFKSFLEAPKFKPRRHRKQKCEEKEKKKNG